MLEKHFSYYKNEKECPFKPSNEAIFWDAEKSYAKTADEQFEARLIKDSQEIAERLQNVAQSELQKKFLSYSPEKKALALYVEQMLQKFCPVDGDSILINY